MNHRAKILDFLLTLLRQKGADSFTWADQLPGFTPGNEAFLGDIRELLARGLIRGVEGPDRRLAVQINPERLDEIATNPTPDQSSESAR